jgi:hypothetical protein
MAVTEIIQDVDDLDAGLAQLEKRYGLQAAHNPNPWRRIS